MHIFASVKNTLIKLIDAKQLFLIKLTPLIQKLK